MCWCVPPIWQCFGVSPSDWLCVCAKCGISWGWLGSQAGYQGILDLGRGCEWCVWDQLARELPTGLKPIDMDAWSSYPYMHTPIFAPDHYCIFPLLFPNNLFFIIWKPDILDINPLLLNGMVPMVILVMPVAYRSHTLWSACQRWIGQYSRHISSNVYRLDFSLVLAKCSPMVFIFTTFRSNILSTFTLLIKVHLELTEPINCEKHV